MSVACAAEVGGRFLWEATLRTSPSSGQATLSALLPPPYASFLPLRGSVRPISLVKQVAQS
jgi:hypothetical protein